MTAVRTVAALCAGILVLAACSAPEDEADAVVPLSWSELVGQPMSAIDPHPEPGGNVYVLDVSVLLGAEPTYSGSEFGHSTWTIVAVCAAGETWDTSSSIEFAVVPTELVTEDFADRIAAGEFASSVTCEGLPYR